MPLEKCKVRIKELKASSTMIMLYLEDTHKLLDDVTSMWTMMEKIPDLMIVLVEV